MPVECIAETKNKLLSSLSQEKKDLTIVTVNNFMDL